MSIDAPAPDSYLTVPQLAAKFQLSRKTVYRRCRQTVNPWPCTRFGEGARAPIRFSPEAVAAIELLQTQGPAGIGPGAAHLADVAKVRKASRKLLAIEKQREGLAA